MFTVEGREVQITNYKEGRKNGKSFTRHGNVVIEEMNFKDVWPTNSKRTTLEFVTKDMIFSDLEILQILSINLRFITDTASILSIKLVHG